MAAPHEQPSPVQPPEGGDLHGIHSRRVADHAEVSRHMRVIMGFPETPEEEAEYTAHHDRVRTMIEELDAELGTVRRGPRFGPPMHIDEDPFD